MSNPAIVAELARLINKSGGLLDPENVVNAARSEDSPLHQCFDWSDNEAAHKWRVHQARNLIRVHVTVIEAGGPKECRAFVSLSTDRQNGGGYRAVVSVLGHAGMREQMLQDAYADMRAFQQKYAALKELSAVFAAIDAAGVPAVRSVIGQEQMGVAAPG